MATNWVAYAGHLERIIAELQEIEGRRALEDRLRDLDPPAIRRTFYESPREGSRRFLTKWADPDDAATSDGVESPVRIAGSSPALAEGSDSS